MEYKLVGRTGVKVSGLCFGTMSFGDTADEAESARMYAQCRDAGINFFDTANVYAQGRSEEILGNLIKHERDNLVITSKVFGRMGDDINARGLSRRHIRLAIEASLKRLQTDRLDFYFVHQFDVNTPIDETLSALDDLVREGLILYPAVSNWAAWQIAKAQGIAAQKNLARFELMQPMYNLSKRQAEVELLPFAKSESIGVIPYSPLGGGLLTGKYTTRTKPDAGRLVENKMYAKRYQDTQHYTTAEAFSNYAQAHNIHPATLAVAWVAAHPAVTAPIIGARNTRQLESSLAAAEFVMSDDMYREVSALSPEPPLANDRSEEKAV